MLRNTILCVPHISTVLHPNFLFSFPFLSLLLHSSSVSFEADAKSIIGFLSSQNLVHLAFDRRHNYSSVMHPLQEVIAYLPQGGLPHQNTQCLVVKDFFNLRSLRLHICERLRLYAALIQLFFLAQIPYIQYSPLNVSLPSESSQKYFCKLSAAEFALCPG